MNNKKQDPTRETVSKRMENFLYHYKYHTIFSVFLLLLISSLGYTIIEKQIAKSNAADQLPADIDIMFFGSYQEENLSPLKHEIQHIFPNWESIHINLVQTPKEVNSAEDMANFQKGQIAIEANKPDIYIFDLNYFHRFVEDGPFLSLDQLELSASAQLLFYQKENDTKEHPYGIDVTNHRLFTNLVIQKKPKIAVIRKDAQNSKNAKAFIKQLDKIK